MKICELCGKEHDGSYGSGRFCCNKCARSFSSKEKRLEINEKVSKAIKGTKAYSNGTTTVFLKDNEKIPEGFIKGNFSLVKHYNFEEFKNLQLLKKRV